MLSALWMSEQAPWALIMGGRVIGSKPMKNTVATTGTLTAA
jgi:hypothetical protein